MEITRAERLREMGLSPVWKRRVEPLKPSLAENPEAIGSSSEVAPDKRLTPSPAENPEAVLSPVVSSATSPPVAPTVRVATDTRMPARSRVVAEAPDFCAASAKLEPA